MEERFYLIYSKEYLEQHPTYPKKVPLIRSKYRIYEFDVVESECPPEFIKERRDISHFNKKLSGYSEKDLKILDSKPLGTDYPPERWGRIVPAKWDAFKMKHLKTLSEVRKEMLLLHFFGWTNQSIAEEYFVHEKHVEKVIKEFLDEVME